MGSFGWAVTITAIVVFLVLLAAAVFVRSLALRVKRLDQRIEHARRRLDSELRHRSACALVLAYNGSMPRAEADRLAACARAALETPLGLKSPSGRDTQPLREAAESELTAAIRAAIGAGGGAPAALADLTEAAGDAAFARRLHNIAVVQARRLRSKYLIEWLRLQGYSVLPDTVELDEDLSVAVRP